MDELVAIVRELEATVGNQQNRIRELEKDVSVIQQLTEIMVRIAAFIKGRFFPTLVFPSPGHTPDDDARNAPKPVDLATSANALGLIERAEESPTGRGPCWR